MNDQPIQIPPALDTLETIDGGINDLAQTCYLLTCGEDFDVIHRGRLPSAHSGLPTARDGGMQRRHRTFNLMVKPHTYGYRYRRPRVISFGRAVWPRQGRQSLILTALAWLVASLKGTN